MSHQWSADAAATTEDTVIIKDAVGNPLQDGDSVTVIKDLKVKGSSLVIKVGTKAKTSAYCPMPPTVMISTAN